jgi:hypothetical protein
MRAKISSELDPPYQITKKRARENIPCSQGKNKNMKKAVSFFCTGTSDLFSHHTWSFYTFAFQGNEQKHLGSCRFWTIKLVDYCFEKELVTAGVVKMAFLICEQHLKSQIEFR